jgi:hypothetical protein
MSDDSQLNGRPGTARAALLVPGILQHAGQLLHMAGSVIQLRRTVFTAKASHIPINI